MTDKEQLHEWIETLVRLRRNDDDSRLFAREMEKAAGEVRWFAWKEIQNRREKEEANDP